MGGGRTLEETREILLDTAERLFVERGIRESTMEVIAREAGYSRNAIYRIFPNRQSLIETAVRRTTQRYMVAIPQRVPVDAHPVDLLTESLLIVATELVHDPLLKTVGEQSSDGTVAKIIANDRELTELVRTAFDAMLANDADRSFRKGLHAGDVAQFFVTTALSMLLDAIPEIHDPDVARRYIDTFVLPALVARPRAAQRVFGTTGTGSSLQPSGTGKSTSDSSSRRH